jgi:hypothetical protein
MNVVTISAIAVFGVLTVIYAASKSASGAPGR